MQQFLLYGAYGYTGKIIIDLAESYGLQAILAGRNKARLAALAAEKKLPYQVFGLDDPQILDKNLEGIQLVLHAAGPFSQTAQPMMEACLRQGVHYVDITGEIEVFERAAAYDEEAKAAGVVLLPGAGFDVVPTDCMALFLKKQLPKAQYLKLAFASVGGGLSRGTARTMVESISEGGRVRKDGEIVKVPMGHKTLRVPFAEKSRSVYAIPWGDVSTAYYSTGIPNIETFIALPPQAGNMMGIHKYLGWLMRSSWFKKTANKRIDTLPPGPDEKALKTGKSEVWGQAMDREGNLVEAQMTTPNGYWLTAHSSLLIARKILEGVASPGFQTPAKAFGEDLVLEIPNVSRALIEDL